jgi:hypothetical protein
MAPQRFHVHNHDQPFHQVNFDVTLYLWFSFFNFISNLLLIHHVQGTKAFLIHCVKLSSLNSRKYIPTFLLQHLIHFFPHIPCQHSCHHKQKWFTRTIKIFLCFSQFWTNEWIAQTLKLLKEIIPFFLVKTNSFYWIIQQKNYWTGNLGSVSAIWSWNVNPTRWIFRYLLTTRNSSCKN